MKKLLLILYLMIISSTCLATANFTSSNGVLVVPDVSVDGTTDYDSVTLKLNLSNGTFTILDATLKDTSFPEIAIETLSSDGFRLDFFGCARSGFNQITCMTKAVSTSKDANVRVTARSNDPDNKLFDNLSREYSLSSATALDNTAIQDEFFGNDSLNLTLIQGIPVEVKFIYEDIDVSASSISAFQPVVVFDGTNRIEGNFRNIDF